MPTSFTEPTVDDLKNYWREHPDEPAVTGDACRCIVVKPLVAMWGYPVTFVPCDPYVTVWEVGTTEFDLSGDNVEASVPVPAIFRAIGHRFDAIRAKTLRGAGCLALIELVCSEEE